jgi:hypothetical protein
MNVYSYQWEGKGVKIMPGLDRIGPLGEGPGTGRRFGPCFGFGRGHLPHHDRGLGRYFRWSWPQTKEDQKKVLTEYRKALEEELGDVKKEEEELGEEK